MRNLFVLSVLLFLLVLGGRAEAGPTHVVRSGDTLYEIALSYDLSWQELARLNGIDDPRKLQIGTVLRLPVHVIPKIICSDGSVCEISQQDKTLLAKLVYAEARGESFEGKVAVAAVVLNRVRSSIFPNTVWDVIHQPGQFTPVESGSLPSTVCEQCLDAVNSALRGEDPSAGALYFFNPATSTCLDYWQTRQVVKTIGNHKFAL